MLALVLLCLQVSSSLGQTRTATSVSLSGSTADIAAGREVMTLSASVAAAGQPVLGGTVDFLDGTRLLSRVQVVTSTAAGQTPGTATLRRLLGPGSHALSARFNGTLSLAPSTSATQTLQGPAQSTNTSRLFITAAYPLPDIGSGVTVADINNDGLPDILVPMFSTGNILIMLNDPANPGHMQPATQLSLPIKATGSSIIVSDLDGDGLPDILMTAQGSQSGDSSVSDGYAWCFYQDPAAPGTFKPATIIQGGLTAPGQIYVRDMDGDGTPDVVFAGDYMADEPVVSSGHSTGTVFHPAAASMGSVPNVALTWTAPNSMTSSETVDLDGDGLPEVIFGGLSNEAAVEVFTSDPTNPGGYSGISRFPQSGSAFDMKAFDANLDGHPDLLIGAVQSGMQLMLNDPSHPGNLLSPSTFPVFRYGLGLGLGDIDGDGNLDAVVATGAPSFSVLLGDGKGSFGPPLNYSSTPVLGETDRLAVADLDGDGLDDVVTITGEYTYVGVPAFQLNISTHVDPGAKQPPAITIAGPAVLVGSSPNADVVEAKLSSVFGLPTGTVDFVTSGGTVAASAQLQADGTAALPMTSLLGQGLVMHAHYEGDANFAAADSNVVSLYLPPNAPSVNLTATPASGLAQQTFTFVAVVTGAASTPAGNLRFEVDGATVSTSALDSSGSARYATTTLLPGTHTVRAAYLGDHDYISAVASTQVTVVTGALALTASSATVAPEQPVTFTATLSGPASLAAVPINFFDNGTALGTATTDANGSATWQSSGLSPGTHQISAQYTSSDTSIQITSNVLSFSVPLITPAISITATPSHAGLGQSITIDATLPATKPLPAPTGSLQFTIDGSAVSTVAADPSGSGSFTTASLTAGSHTVQVNYQGDQFYAPAATSLTVTISAPSIVLSASTSSTAPFQSIAFTAVLGSLVPAGARSISFFDNGTLLGTSVTDANGNATWQSAGLNPGQHQMTAQYTMADGSGKITSNSLSYNISLVPTAVSLLIAPSTAIAGQPVTVTATIKASAGASVPAGTVSFLEDSVVLGTATLDATGQADLTAPSQTTGSHSLTANYAGTSTFASSSATASVTVVAPDFAVSVSQPEVSVSPASPGKVSLSLSAINGFSDPVELSCTGLPSTASCTFAPATAAWTSGQTQSVLTITETGSASNGAPGSHTDSSAIAFALLGLPWLLALRGRRRLANTLPLLLLALAGSLLVGCGSSGNAASVARTPVTATVQLTATGQKTGTSHSTSVVVTLQ